MKRGRGLGLERPPAWAIVVTVLATAGLIVGLTLPGRTHPLTAAQKAKANQDAARISALYKKPAAAFLGDSYTAASTNGNLGEYALATARMLNWTATPLGQGGTGYVNPGAAGETTYINRVPDVVKLHPDIVIVQGGENDALVGGCTDEQQAAAAVFAALRSGLPKAQIIAIASVAGPATNAALIKKCTAGIAAAATQYKVPVIDPVAKGWLPNPASFVDGIHPTQAGFSELVGDLVPALKAATSKS